jgi:hypothetical protein
MMGSLWTSYSNLWSTHTMMMILGHIVMILGHIVLWVVIGIHWLGWANIIFDRKPSGGTDDEQEWEDFETPLLVIFWPITIVIIFTTIAIRFCISTTRKIDRGYPRIKWVLCWVLSCLEWIIARPFHYLHWVIMGYGRLAPKRRRRG